MFLLRVWRAWGLLAVSFCAVPVITCSIPADVFDIDLFDVPAPVLAALKARGRRIVCYFSAGSYEVRSLPPPPPCSLCWPVCRPLLCALRSPARARVRAFMR
jgi:hypothetical protein